MPTDFETFAVKIASVDYFVRDQINTFLVDYLTVPNLPFLAAHLHDFFRIIFYTILLIIPMAGLKVSRSESGAINALLYSLLFVFFACLALIFFGFFVLLFETT